MKCGNNAEIEHGIVAIIRAHIGASINSRSGTKSRAEAERRAGSAARSPISRIRGPK